MVDVNQRVIAGHELLLLRSQPEPCEYLPGRSAQFEHFPINLFGRISFQQLLDSGFRRSGSVVYRPACPSCQACEPLRVPVAAFKPSRSQRRVWRRNADIRVRAGPPTCGPRRLAIYRSYLRHVHAETGSAPDAHLRWFICESPVRTLELSYWLGRKLLAAGIVDVTPIALSSVYFYYDPEHADRSLGVFSALYEIEECRRRGLAWWYVGYYVAGCRKMAYKRDYRPHQLLDADGVWRERPHQPR